MKRKLYICPVVEVFDCGVKQPCLTAVSGTLSGYNQQGDDAEFSRSESDWTDGGASDDADLW